MTISDEPRVWPKPVPKQERRRVVLNEGADPVEERGPYFEYDSTDDHPDQLIEGRPQPERAIVPIPSEVGGHYRLDPWSVQSPRPSWRFAQLLAVAVAGCVVMATFMTVGYAAGSSREPDRLARSEFIFTLDESIPDGYLREDRRLLTQIATLKSEAVLAPVAARFGTEVEDLRKRISVETVQLSEVIRLDVRHIEPATALALNQAVLAEYLKATEAVSPIADVTKLDALRDELATDLQIPDGQVKALRAGQIEDVQLQTREEELGRLITASSDRIASLEGLLDEQLVRPTTALARSALRVELASSTEELAVYSGELLTVRTKRATLAEASIAEPALVREVERISKELADIETEITRRELTEFDAAPVQMLTESTVLTKPANSPKVRGLAIAALVGLPFAALAAWLQRRRQLNRG